MTIRRAISSDKEQLLFLLNKFDDFYISQNLFSQKLMPLIEYKDKDQTFREVIDGWLSIANEWLTWLKIKESS